jgi:hypothetical protein
VPADAFAMAGRAGSMQRVYRRFAAALVACVLTLAAAAPAQGKTPQPYQRGFVLTGWTAGSYLRPGSDSGIRRMADDGSNQAAIFTQWFIATPTSSQIAPDPDRTPTDASILHAVEVARAAGMSVTLKPQIGIRTGNWIGYAHPADPDTFWADYRTMLLHYADLAQQGGATVLVVGTEMATLSSDESRWRSLIAEVRTRFSGQLTYAANYDEFERVPFWEALDYIGIDGYFGLADDSDPAPGVDSLTAAWGDRGYLARIAAVSEQTRRNVLFTEIGYRATHATAAHPNIWNGTQVTDTAAQGAAYEAFYRAVSQQPWMAGFYWWEMNADTWWVQDYNPFGKDAERVLVDWNTRLAAVADPAATPPTDPPVTDPPPDPPPPPADPPSTPSSDPVPPLADAPPAEPTPPAGSNPVIGSDSPSPPAPTTPATVHPAQFGGTPKPVIYLMLRAKHLVGLVVPYHRACRAQVQLRIRVMRAHRWRYERAPARLTLDTGAFATPVPNGRLKVKAVYSGSCGNASSPWVTRSV